MSLASLCVWLTLTAVELPALPWPLGSDWLNVRDRGAVGDGRADDTAALQAALTGLRDGATVFLPAGTYRLTAGLTLTGPLVGLTIVGQGRDTRLVWDGPPGGAMLTINGVAYSRFIGLDCDGRGVAATGLRHWSDKRFQTEVRHQHLALRNLTDAGISAATGDKYALAETQYENCLFDHCARGVALLSFNDYNHTVDGCEFLDCGIGLECRKGNAYVRNSHFARSATADLLISPEHSASVRRCTSLDSRQFLDYAHPVGPLIVQDCHVAGWTGPNGAISLAGAPVMLFDCTFARPPDDRPAVRVKSSAQRLIMSGVEAAVEVRGRRYNIPAGTRGPAVADAGRRFFRSVVAVPPKLFDARRDFGAAGDGRTDDTDRLQQTIDAARNHGRGALAYLPTGRYIVTRPLQIRGADYRVGGSGFRTQLVWRGPAGEGQIFEVVDPRRVALEQLAVGHGDAGASNSRWDILQTSAGGPSSMVYDGVFCYGLYRKEPEVRGFGFVGLGAGVTVNLLHAQGNLRFRDCGDARILGSCTYEGAIVVEGPGGGRDGQLGFLTRLCTISQRALIVRDSHRLTLSDFYIEQADNGFLFAGRADDPPGRVVIQGAKFHIQGAGDIAPDALHFAGYRGELFFGPNQFYVEPPRFGLAVGEAGGPELFCLGNAFYKTRLEVPEHYRSRVTLLGNQVFGSSEPALLAAAADTADVELARLIPALDALRALGELDLALNHPD